MTTAPPDRAALELRQIELTNQKLEVETRKLGKDCEPARGWERLGKGAVAFGAVVSIIATLIGLIYSFDKTIEERQQTRRADERARFEQAITRLEKTLTLSKLVGLSVLNGYATSADSQVRRQTLFTLAGFAGTETDVQGQTALADLVAGLPSRGSLTGDDWSYFQGLLVSQSRSLTDKADLVRKRQLSDDLQVSPLTPDEKTAHALGTLIAAIARRGVAPNYIDYADIYCADCDFTHVVFPKGVDFSSSVLDDTDFSGATLRDARFDNAELPLAQFVEADLSGASFRSTYSVYLRTAVPNGAPVPLGRTMYLRHLVSALSVDATVWIGMPNFSCANLTGAQFSGHALFPIPVTAGRKYSRRLANSHAKVPAWYSNVSQHVLDRADEEDPTVFVPLRVVPPKFFKARLGGAHLEEAQFFSIGDNASEGYFKTYSYTKAAEFEFLEGYVSEVLWEMLPADSPRPWPDVNLPVHNKMDAARVFQSTLRGIFYSTEWGTAVLSKEMRDSLTRSPPTKADFSRVFSSPSMSVDPDLRCTPRT